MTVPWLHNVGDDVAIELHVIPRASRTAVLGEHDGRLRIAVAAPPVDGEANDEIVRFFASALRVPRRDVTIASGATGKRKRLLVSGSSIESVSAALAPEAR